MEPVVRVRLTDEPIPVDMLRAERPNSGEFGGYATFEGIVRNHNDGKKVKAIEYEAYYKLALLECERIGRKVALEKGVGFVELVHRLGHLEVGDVAVFVQVMSHHRREAFEACIAIMDEIKATVPIWKKEFYVSGEHAWPHCSGCQHGAG